MSVTSHNIPYRCSVRLVEKETVKAPVPFNESLPESAEISPPTAVFSKLVAAQTKKRSLPSHPPSSKRKTIFTIDKVLSMNALHLGDENANEWHPKVSLLNGQCKKPAEKVNGLQAVKVEDAANKFAIPTDIKYAIQVAKAVNEANQFIIPTDHHNSPKPKLEPKTNNPTAIKLSNEMERTLIDPASAPTPTSNTAPPLVDDQGNTVHIHIDDPDTTKLYALHEEYIMCCIQRKHVLGISQTLKKLEAEKMLCNNGRNAASRVDEREGVLAKARTFLQEWRYTLMPSDEISAPDYMDEFEVIEGKEVWVKLYEACIIEIAQYSPKCKTLIELGDTSVQRKRKHILKPGEVAVRYGFVEYPDYVWVLLGGKKSEHIFPRGNYKKILRAQRRKELKMSPFNCKSININPTKNTACLYSESDGTLPDGWRLDVVKRRSIEEKKIDRFWYTKTGKKLRSKVEVYRFLCCLEKANGDEEYAFALFRGKVIKPRDNAPKRFMTSFMCFSKEHRARIQSENPEAEFGDVSRLVGAAFKNLSAQDKKQYIKLARKDRQRYNVEMKNYTPPSKDPDSDDSDTGAAKKRKTTENTRESKRRRSMAGESDTDTSNTGKDKVEGQGEVRRNAKRVNSVRETNEEEVAVQSASRKSVCVRADDSRERLKDGATIRYESEDGHKDNDTAADDEIIKDSPAIEPAISRITTLSRSKIVHGRRTSLAAVRIAIGATVLSTECELEFQPGERRQHLTLFYEDNKVHGDGNAEATKDPINSSNCDGRNFRCINIETNENTAITELKYYIAKGGEEDDLEPQIPRMSFFAMRVSPNVVNGLDQFPHYLSDDEVMKEECRTKNKHNLRKRYIVVEVQDKEKFVNFLKKIVMSTILNQFMDNAELKSPAEITRYTMALEHADNSHGIQLGFDPNAPLPPLSCPSAALMNSCESSVGSEGAAHKCGVGQLGDNQVVIPKMTNLLTEEHSEEMKRQKVYPLVLPDDKPLISDYLYLTFEQMEPCKHMNSDCVGFYKGRQMDFPGLACKWCVGQARCGRYFPASEESLQITTKQTILNHVRNCSHCPITIRENLELLRRSKMGPDDKGVKKPEHDGIKIFFHRVWCRIQGLPIDEMEVKRGRSKGSKNKAKQARNKASSSPNRNPKIDNSNKYSSDNESTNDSSVDDFDKDGDSTEMEDEDDASDHDNDDNDDGNDHSHSIDKKVSVAIHLREQSPQEMKINDSFEISASPADCPYQHKIKSVGKTLRGLFKPGDHLTTIGELSLATASNEQVTILVKNAFSSGQPILIDRVNRLVVKLSAGPHDGFEVTACTKDCPYRHQVKSVGRSLNGVCKVGDHLIKIGNLALANASPEQVTLLVKVAKIGELVVMDRVKKIIISPPVPSSPKCTTTSSFTKISSTKLNMKRIENKIVSPN